MSRALFVSERTLPNFLYTNYSHRPAQTCRRPLAHLPCLLCAAMAQRFECVPTRHDGFYTHPSHCVPPQHNVPYHTDTSECNVYIMWSASGLQCEFISVNSRKYNTV